MRAARSLAVVLCCLSVAAAAQPAGNLLVNPDLEAGAAGWGGDVTLVEDPDQAHSGRFVYVGSVDRKESHQRLTQSLSLQEGVLYELSFWARSDSQNMVVLWIQSGDTRFNPDRWEKVPATWRRYATRFSVPRTDTWEIQLILPSSHGPGPLGKAWADDLALRSLGGGEITALTPKTGAGGVGSADHGTLAVAPDGALWAAWERFEPEGDALVVARLTGTPPAIEREWRVALPPSSYTLWPRLVAGPAGVWLVTAAEIDRQWDLLAVPLGAGGPGEPVRVTSDEAADVDVCGAVDESGLHLAWESNRDGARRVWGARLANGAVSAPEPLGEPGSYNPALLAGGGRMHLAYDRYAEGNRDLWLRVRQDDGWGDARRLTASNRYDLNPALAWWRDGLWVAWESSWHAGYNISSLERRGLRLARVGETALEVPEGFDAEPLGNFAEYPELLVDREDRLWMLGRAAEGQSGRGGWTTRAACATGEGWSEWLYLSALGGRARRPSAVALEGRLLAALQHDNIHGGWRSHEEAAQAFSRLSLADLATADLAPAGTVRVARYGDADTAEFNIAAERQRMGEDRAPFTFEHDGRRLAAHFGNFHEHSDISICRRGVDLRTEEDYVAMREVARFGFGAVTDHCYNFAPAIWRYAKKVTRASHDPGRFVTFAAEEWTSNNEKTTKPPGYYGHRNLIFADPYKDAWYNSRDQRFYSPEQVWNTLEGQNYIMIPHQLADAGTNVPIDWDYTHETYQPVAEMFQARQSYEADDAPRRTAHGYPGYFMQDVWARGIKIGVIASPDHGGGQGKAGVLTDDLSREGILNACRARHTWGTSAAKIAMAVTVDGHLMGDVAPRTGDQPVRVHVRVSAAGPVKAVRIIRNNEIVHSHTEPGPELNFEYLDNVPPAGSSYYYVRVEREDDELAWSSPVWLDR